MRTLENEKAIALRWLVPFRVKFYISPRRFVLFGGLYAKGVPIKKTLWKHFNRGMIDIDVVLDMQTVLFHMTKLSDLHKLGKS